MPQDPEDYVHRIGRTARFGAEGEAISFICEEYAYSMPDIETFIGQKVPVQKITQEWLPEIKKPQRRTKNKIKRSLGRSPSRSSGGVQQTGMSSPKSAIES